MLYLECLAGQHDRVFQASPSGLVSLGLLEFKYEENGNSGHATVILVSSRNLTSLDILLASVWEAKEVHCYKTELEEVNPANLSSKQDASLLRIGYLILKSSKLSLKTGQLDKNLYHTINSGPLTDAITRRLSASPDTNFLWPLKHSHKLTSTNNSKVRGNTEPFSLITEIRAACKRNLKPGYLEHCYWVVRSG